MFCAVQKLAGLDYVSAFIRVLCCDNGRGRRIADDCFGDLLVQTALSRVVKHIQAWLGHSTYNTTANLYAHLDSESKVGVGTVMENLLDLSSALETV